MRAALFVALACLLGCSTAPATSMTVGSSAPSAGPAPIVDASASAAPSASAVRKRYADAPPPDPALVERLKADVRMASGERQPGTAGWMRVQMELRQRLKEAGFEVEVHAYDPFSKNILGIKKGTKSPDEVVILSAHYDHVWGCDGADDNASGVAVVLEAARVLGAAQPDRTLVLAFWDHEEDGLHGSNAYAQRARQRRENIRMMISLDGVGYADARPGSQQMPDAVGLVLPDMLRELEENEMRGDFIAVIGDEGSSPAIDAFDEYGERRGLPVMGAGLSALSRIALLDAARSDHASFWLAGFPGILVTDTANFRNPRYHCIGGPDTPESLDYGFLARVTLTTIDVVTAALST